MPPLIFERLKLYMSANEILDYNFLALVDRSWIGTEIGKVPNLEPLDLSGEDRGVVEGALEDGRPCTIRFLRCIKFNLLALVLTYISSGALEPSRLEDLHEFLDHDDPEIERLHLHPELFPNQVLEEVFFHDVHNICNLLLTQCIPQKDKILEQHGNLMDTAKNDFEKLVMPARDERRKPWQQYFHNNAPGSGVKLPPIPGSSCTQLMPVGACELFMKWKEERQAILTAMNIVDTPRPPIPVVNVTPHGTRIRTAITLGGNERATWMSMNCLPQSAPLVTLRKARDMVVSEPSTLERLNESFATLKGVVPGRPWPSTMRRSCYVIRERPHPASRAKIAKEAQQNNQTQTNNY